LSPRTIGKSSRNNYLVGTLDSADALREASGLMMGLALHLGRGLGAEPTQLAEHWIKTAKQHGAKD